MHLAVISQRWTLIRFNLIYVLVHLRNAFKFFNLVVVVCFLKCIQYFNIFLATCLLIYRARVIIQTILTMFQNYINIFQLYFFLHCIADMLMSNSYISQYIFIYLNMIKSIIISTTTNSYKRTYLEDASNY